MRISARTVVARYCAAGDCVGVLRVEDVSFPKLILRLLGLAALMIMVESRGIV